MSLASMIVQALSQLRDVSITTPTNNQLLRYVTAHSKWENTTDTGFQPNTKVQLDYAASTDISGTAVVRNTWTDTFANQTFTVDDANSVVEIEVDGNLLVGNNAAAASIGSRLVIDSAGTPINKQLGGGRSPVNEYSNVLSGASTVSLTGLAVGSHTVKLQVYLNTGSGNGDMYCQIASSPNVYSLSIRVLERKQSSSIITTNSVVRYHQITATAQSISNTTTTIINYDTQDIDTQSLVTTGASWKCTATASGNYNVNASAVLTSAVWAGTGIIRLFLYKNGALYSLLGESTVQVANTDEFAVEGQDIIALSATDYIDIRVYHNQGGAVTLIGDSTRNYVGINKIS